MTFLALVTPLTQATSHTSGAWPWYLIRASGITAAALMVVLMISGIGMVTGHWFRLMEPVQARLFHRTIGIALGVSVALHITGILFDKYIKFSISSVAVPFLSDYRRIELVGIPVGSLGVALGVLSLYLLALIISTSLLALNRYPRLWKLVHYFGYFVIFTVFFHGLMLGTDLASGLWRGVWAGFGALIMVAILVRLTRVGS